MSARVVEARKAEVTGPREGSTTPRPPRDALVDLGTLTVFILLALLFWNHTCRKMETLVMPGSYLIHFSWKVMDDPIDVTEVGICRYPGYSLLFLVLNSFTESPQISQKPLEYRDICVLTSTLETYPSSSLPHELPLNTTQDQMKYLGQIIFVEKKYGNTARNIFLGRQKTMILER